MFVVAGANEIADSTHGDELTIVIWAVLDPLEPLRYSLHPYTEAHVDTSE